MEQLEAWRAPVELPEVGRLYKSADGTFCRIIELVENQDRSRFVVYRPLHTSQSEAIGLYNFLESVEWPDGVYRQRFTPAAHLPPSERVAG